MGETRQKITAIQMRINEDLASKRNGEQKMVFEEITELWTETGHCEREGQKRMTEGTAEDNLGENSAQ